MPDPIKVTIGGEEIIIPPIMNFATLERAWPAICAWNATSEDVEKEAANIALISAALIVTRPEMSVAEIKLRLKAGLFGPDGKILPNSERMGLSRAANDLLVASGLAPSGPVSAGEELPPEPPAAPAN
jgi:hypothetical protein